MANKIIHYKTPSEYWAKVRQAEWYGATSLVALAVIFLLGSLAAIGIYLTHALPLLNTTEALITIAGSLAAGGSALLTYGIYTLKHHARQEHRGEAHQAQAIFHFLLNNPDRVKKRKFREESEAIDTVARNPRQATRVQPLISSLS